MRRSSIALSSLDAEDILRIFFRERYRILIAAGIGLILALGYSLTIPNQYESVARLMPPDQQNLPGNSLLGMLAGAAAGGSSAGALLSPKKPGQIFMGIIASDTAQNDLIKQFNLQQVYHCKLLVDCRNSLAARTVTSESELNGIISITVRDTDPRRASVLTTAYIQELDKLVNSLSTSSARREREFLEERLTAIKQNLDESARALSQFSSKNAALNPQNQGQSLLESAAKLQGELITAEAELSGLRAQYTDGNVRVLQAEARVNELRSQLNRMSGLGNAESGAQPGSTPTIRELPLLDLTYADLARQVTVQEGIYDTLTKQYEIAKVEESKEIPSVKVLDQPEIPERKSSPHRLVISLIGCMLFGFGAMAWFFFKDLLYRFKNAAPADAQA